jgi:hypothetical protein
MVTLFPKAEGALVKVRDVIPARFVRLVGEKGIPVGL